MKEKKVIAFKNFPRKMPLVSTIAWWLFLDRINAPGWLWGCIGLLVVLGWIAFFHSLFTAKEVEVDLFETNEADRTK